MYRYGRSGGYRGRRRATHRVRNSLIVLLLLLIGGAALAQTDAGASFLDRMGLNLNPQDQAQTTPSPAGTSVAVGDAAETAPVPTVPPSEGSPGTDSGNVPPTAVVTPSGETQATAEPT